MHELTAVVVSCLTRVEVPSAVWRKHRGGQLDVEDVVVLVAAFEADYFAAGGDPGDLAVLALTDGMLEETATLTATQGLRALDALQLASALAARRADPDCTTFACFDERLRVAAASAGFALLPSP